MDLNELKKAWKNMSSASAENDLSEEKILALLSKRTSNLMERLDKNIRLGIGILFLTVTFLVVWNLGLKDLANLEDDSLTFPKWITFLDRFMNYLILILFLTFSIHYYQIRKKCSSECTLREKLVKMIGVLTSYKRLFVMALTILMLAISGSYLVGFYTGSHMLEQSGIELSATILAGIVSLVLLAGLIFIFIRWAFRRSYGKYLDQLKNTLLELDEIGE